MPDRAPFNPDDPFDAIANLAKTEFSFVAYMPQAVDQARSILGLPPLPEADQ